MEIRKFCTFIEDINSEMDKSDGRLLRKVAVAAIMKNPFSGRYEQDLSLLVEESRTIAAQISEIALGAMGMYEIESYGKGAIVGINGDIEHGVAMLTSEFGNVFREKIGGGKAWITSTKKRAMPGSTIDIPLAHKDALYVRSHYDGMSITLHDAPLPDEIAIFCCVANRGRLNARSGGLVTADIIGEDGLF